MTGCVVEVGPATVRGPRRAPPTVVATALECIDDDIAILDDAPVAVAALWREVFDTVLPDGLDAAVLVCPTWWSPARVEIVHEAAAARSAKVTVLHRYDALSGDADDPTVVEIAPELVVTVRAGEVVAADPRSGGVAEVAQTVADRIGPSATVLVDAPAGVVGGTELAGAIAERLRADGAAVTTVHRDRVLRVARTPDARRRRPSTPRRSRVERSAAVAALPVTVTVLCFGVALGTAGPEPASPPMTLLVEGRVALKVPALWPISRVTSGPGSARLQVTAPDGSAALLVTQSQVSKGETLATAAAALRRALEAQPPGVFSAFEPEGRRAGRPAVTYREVRDGRRVDWAVFVDDAVRIAVGCQRAGDDEVIRDVCDVAVGSAHAVT